VQGVSAAGRREASWRGAVQAVRAKARLLWPRKHLRLTGAAEQAGDFADDRWATNGSTELLSIKRAGDIQSGVDLLGLCMSGHHQS